MDDKWKTKIKRMLEKLEKIRKNLERLQSLSLVYGRDAYDAVESITQIINEEQMITWRDLGITQDECKELARLTKVKLLKSFVYTLRRGTIPTVRMATSAIMHIREKVADGTTSWEEIKTTKEEIEELERRSKTDSN